MMERRAWSSFVLRRMMLSVEVCTSLLCHLNLVIACAYCFQLRPQPEVRVARD